MIIHSQFLGMKIKLVATVFLYMISIQIKAEVTARSILSNIYIPEGNDSIDISVSHTSTTKSNTIVKPYKIAFLDSNACNSSPFIDVSIVTTASISNVTGFDIALSFDNSKLIPNGTVTFTNDLIYNQYLGYASNVNNGKINISIYLNGNGGNKHCNGNGTVATIRFAKTAEFHEKDSVLFFASMVESYETATIQKQVLSSIYATNSDSVFTGKLVYWATKSPIPSDATVNQTKIIYNSLLGLYTTTNADGIFTLNNQKSTFTINKNLDKNIDAITVINGYDAFLTAIVAVDDPSFVPTIYQIIAMDVNQDGVISAGDISLINKRSVNTIESFSPKTNLQNDWVFIDEETILSDSKYKLSLVYPVSDGIGYSKTMVPIISSDLDTKSKNGCSKPKKTYIGILLGDVDGSYKTINQTLKSNIIDTSNKVVFDFKNAVSTYINGEVFLDVPLIVQSHLGINSLDFSVQIDDSRLQFISIANNKTAIKSYFFYDVKDKTIRFTSYSKLGEYETNNSILALRFKIVNDGFSDGIVTSSHALINGDFVTTEITSKESDLVIDGSHLIDVYPNPASNIIQIVVSKTSQITIYSEFNQVMYTIDNQEANLINSINLEGLSNGIYYIKVSNSNTSATKVFVKQ